MNYTVMGDTVNLSSRLEGINKFYNTSIVASESTWLLVKEQIVGRALDIVAVKGKSQGVRVYELLGLRATATAQDLELEKIAEHGIAAFVAKDMVTAKADFNRILEMKETDQSAKLILQRIADYEAMPDKSAWSAVNALAAK